MMKKCFILLGLCLIIGLSSCSNSAKRELIRDEPATDIYEALHLDAVENGNSLNPLLDKSTAYADIKISNNPSESLIYQTIDLDEYIGERFKQINLKILYFNGQIPVNDVTAFMQEMNNENYGISKEKVRFDFVETENVSEVLYHKLSILYSLSLPNDYVVKDGDPSKLVVAYLPTYCIYNDGSQDYTKVFILVPIYYAFAYASNESTYTKGLTYYNIELVDTLLPSKSKA